MPKTRQTHRNAAIRGFIEEVRAGQIPGIGTPNPMRVLMTVNVEDAPEGQCAVCHCELVGRQTTLCSGHWDYVLFDDTDVCPYTGYLTRLADSNAGTTVYVDLDGVTVLDDTGLGMLLGATGRARHRGGDLVGERRSGVAHPRRGPSRL